MADPNITQIPAPRVDFIDPRTGLMSRQWYRFFLNLFNLTGGDSNATSISDLQVGPLSDATGLAAIQAQSTALEVAPAYQDQLAELTKTVEGMELAPRYQPEVQTVHYGAFQDNTTQTAAAINTPYSITFDTTDFELGVSRGTPTSRIVCQNVGVYNFQFSLQMTKTAASLGYAYIWPRINGVNVPDTATRIAFQGSNTDLVAAWNFILQMKAGDYFELMWAVDDTSIQLVHYAAVAFAPGIPSAILTVTQVNI